MIFPRKTPSLEKLEAKGDKLRAKKKHREALHHYKQAASVDKDKMELYNKMLATLNEADGAWTEEDFAESLGWEMRKQELSDPAFKRIHARHTPEFKEVVKWVKGMLAAKTTPEETDFIERIAAHGADAVYPLVDFLLALKGAGKTGRDKA